MPIHVDFMNSCFLPIIIRTVFFFLARLVRFDPLGHNLLTAIVNPSNQQVRNDSFSCQNSCNGMSYVHVPFQKVI